ncbi:MAG TPA: TIR domain-containing protein, partial [Alphaproteobacteria bacterium]|nr:TIR domain-containing protein [Alphaproteobacteria bacterium]
MADIFVSYARADRALIAPLVAALEAQGLSVWWDPEIKAGQEFDQLISAEMAAAKAVIAVWTPTSVDSRWVRGEAREAADRGVLVPVRFGNARMPLDVRSLHTIELDDWREDKASAPFQELLRALTPLIGTKVPKAQTPASGGAPRVRMTTIVSLDVAGYSKRTEADEAAAARQIMALRSRLAAIAVRRGGRIFNTAGDSIMLEFAAAQEAVAAIFELLDDRPLSEPETRVGAHLGDVTVASNGGLLGHGVNVAARLMVQAQPGRALISSELKGALDHQIARPMRDMGELVLAKMDTRIHAFEIVPENAAPNKGLAKAKLKPRHALAIGGTALIVLLAGFLAMKAFVPNRTKPAAPMSAGTLPAASASRSPDTASLAPAKPRIAILPFENLSPDPNNAFFTDGMHEEILTALANAAPGLDVISRTTMDSYKGKPVTIEQLAKDLGCSHVLEGSVRREGNEVRLTLQLINARDDSHVWAEDYDRKLTSAMALQSEVAKKVAEQLSLKIAPRVQAAATNDPLAYDLYLKARLARQNLTGYSDVREWNGAIALLDQAIKLDPNFVQAYLARFDIHFWLFTANYDVSQGRLDLARADLSKAESLAPNDPSVIAAKAAWAFLELDFSRALSLFEQAQSAGFADPNFLVWKASSFAAVGRFDRDLEAIRHAVAL